MLGLNNSLILQTVKGYRLEFHRKEIHPEGCSTPGQGPSFWTVDCSKNLHETSTANSIVKLQNSDRSYTNYTPGRGKIVPRK